MKKSMLALGLAACAVSLFAACKKDTATTNPTTTGSIVVAGNTMKEFAGQDSVTTDFFGYTGNILGVEGTNADSSKQVAAFFIFNGNAKPASGTYTVGDNSAGHVAISFFYYNTTGEGLYASSGLAGTTTVNATVTNTNGKIAITVPSLRVAGLFTPSAAGSSVYNDTTTFSGTFIEQ